MARKGTCSHCERRVRAGSTDGALVAAVHDSPDGTLCPGTGLLVVGPTEPTTARRKKPNQAAKKSVKAAKRGKRTKQKSRPGREISDQKLATIRSSEALERAAWDSALQWDMGGRRSVRTVSGGAPTLGKRR